MEDLLAIETTPTSSGVMSTSGFMDENWVAAGSEDWRESSPNISPSPSSSLQFTQNAGIFNQPFSSPVSSSPLHSMDWKNQSSSPLSSSSSSPQPSSSSFSSLTSESFEKKRTELIEEQRGNILRLYEAKQQALLEDKIKLSNEKRQEILQQARTEIDKFYEDRRQRIAKAAIANREREPRESSRQTDMSNEEMWQLLPKLVELSSAKTEGRDISRMRQVLLSTIPPAKSK
jgi:hypothetical protein